MPLKSIKREDLTFKSRTEILSATLYGNSPVGVVLCPPHPKYGGQRSDTRLVKIARELAIHHITALCIDYGSYGEGITEVQNVLDALSYLHKWVTSIGLLGYSFGAVVASNVAARTQIDGFVALSILKNINGLTTIVDFKCPKLFIHGKRDTVAPYSEFKSIYGKVEGNKTKLVLDTDHFYLEDHPTTMDHVSKTICEFFERTLFK